jgi:hypothetical protein
MSSWRERATAIRALLEKRKRTEATAARFGAREPEGALTRQAAFARRVSAEVLTPVLQEFSRIVTGKAATPVSHEYHARAFGLTCDLDSQRLAVTVFLVPDGKVRLAVNVLPAETEGWHKDFQPNARNEQIEEWFGTALARLFQAA